MEKIYFLFGITLLFFFWELKKGNIIRALVIFVVSVLIYVSVGVDYIDEMQQIKNMSEK